MIVPLITLRSWEIPVHICSVLHIVQREMFAGAHFHGVTRGASSRNFRVFNFCTCLTWDHTQIFVEPRPTPPGTCLPGTHHTLFQITFKLLRKTTLYSSNAMRSCVLCYFGLLFWCELSLASSLCRLLSSDAPNGFVCLSYRGGC